MANTDIPAGTLLKVEGHHHEIIGLTPQLLERETVGNLAPYYLLNGTTLTRDLKAGEPLTLDHVDLSASPLARLYREGLSL